SEDEVLRLAASAESHSSHPVALSLMRSAEEAGLVLSESKNVEEIAGHGLSADVDGHCVLAGNDKLMKLKGIPCADVCEAGTAVHVAADGEYAGYIIIADQLKDDAAAAVSMLETAGITAVMLTGDRRAAAEQAGRSLGISRIFAELLPADKVAKIEEILAEVSAGGKVMFAGDGINDAPVLARADVGIAMGALGSDAAIEAADIVIMNDEPSAILTLVRIAKKTLSIVRQNIVFALGVKLLVLMLSALGYANMWAAVFADVGVSMIAIINSMRLLKK
ncbi:MAG: HAD-IC family P-type ATPase, partial [Firmicutes bacterium]|nr:HAD-IC family P-type ATPase [Bacillota bacterium]